MWQEVRAQGTTLSLRTINRFVAALRQESGNRPRTFRSQPPGQHYHPDRTRHRPWTALQAMRVVLTIPVQREPWEQAYLDHLIDYEPRVAEAEGLAQAFCTILRTRTGDALDQWLLQAQDTAIQSLRMFAKGLVKDYAAVKAGLTLPWSNGQTEAQIQRLKVIKRQCYGRAGFALLRKRVLYQGSTEVTNA